MVAETSPGSPVPGRSESCGPFGVSSRTKIIGKSTGSIRKRAPSKSESRSKFPLCRVHRPEAKDWAMRPTTGRAKPGMAIPARRTGEKGGIDVGRCCSACPPKRSRSIRLETGFRKLARGEHVSTHDYSSKRPSPAFKHPGFLAAGCRSPPGPIPGNLPSPNSTIFSINCPPFPGFSPKSPQCDQT